MQLKNCEGTKFKKVCVFSTDKKLDIEVLKMISNLKLNDTIQLNFVNDGSLKKKLAKANKIGAYGCLILGEDEWKSKQVIWKDFSSGNQKLINFNNINEFLIKDI